jgi:probable biosynthetic protein (TIGR04098 family)
MDKFLEILKKAVPNLTPEDFVVPIVESGIHSLDTVIIRDTLENHFRYEIPDEDWYGFTTLAESLNFLISVTDSGDTSYALQRPDRLYRTQEIRLPQMGNSALSENWLLKEIGDIHWELLSRGLEQKSSEFADGDGNRLYAAFVRICYSLSPLSHFKENERLHLKGEIVRNGSNIYHCAIRGFCNNNYIKASLITSFSSKNADDNTRFSNGKPNKNGVNHIAEVDTTSNFYTEHRLLKKGRLDTLRSGGHDYKLADTVINSITHNINPHYEINGVGLLYFAAYPMIADEGIAAYMKDNIGMPDYDSNYHTVHLDIFYIANCNASDKIRVELNSIEYLETDKIKMASSLYRESD